MLLPGLLYRCLNHTAADTLRSEPVQLLLYNYKCSDWSLFNVNVWHWISTCFGVSCAFSLSVRDRWRVCVLRMRTLCSVWWLRGKSCSSAGLCGHAWGEEHVSSVCWICDDVLGFAAAPGVDFTKGWRWMPVILWAEFLLRWSAFLFSEYHAVIQYVMIGPVEGGWMKHAWNSQTFSFKFSVWGSDVQISLLFLME